MQKNLWKFYKNQDIKVLKLKCNINNNNNN